MNKFVSIVIVLIGLTGCAHHHDKAAHHHHKKDECTKNCKVHSQVEQFDKTCALSLSEGDLHVHGKEEYKLEHGGKAYYFSSNENMKKFKNHLEENIKKANQNWKNYKGGNL